MSHRHIGIVLRSLARAGPAVADADLLRRFAAGRDDDAFAALVERHGRLVWAVCRHLAGPDADDAFQATFLVLLKSGGRIRNPDRLPAWLHGVAFRVSSKARRAAARRAGRERAAAVPEQATAFVPESAWDRALAAVHEEVARLPEVLRVPFVLCVLDGRAVTEAAARLGCKVKTLSARLVRAKETLLARLQARGLAAGAVAALAVAAEAVPASAARAAIAARGGSVDPRVQILTQGVVGMSTHQVKLLAAGVVLALGLGAGGGARWLATAGAQSSAPGRTPTPEEQIRRLEVQLERAKRELADQRTAERQRAEERAGRLATAQWRYEFVPVHDLDAEGFVKLLRERETAGWDYAGQTTLKREAVWAFRRPLRGQFGNWTDRLDGDLNRQNRNSNQLTPGTNDPFNPPGQFRRYPADTVPPAGAAPANHAPGTGSAPPPADSFSPKPEKPAPSGTPPPRKE